jgi:hypothetical protein
MNTDQWRLIAMWKMTGGRPQRRKIKKRDTVLAHYNDAWSCPGPYMEDWTKRAK